MKLLKLTEKQKKEYRKALEEQRVQEWFVSNKFHFTENENEAHIKISGNEIKNLIGFGNAMTHREKLEHWKKHNYTKYSQCDVCKLYFTKKILNPKTKKHICFFCFSDKKTKIYETNNL